VSSGSYAVPGSATPRTDSFLKATCLLVAFSLCLPGILLLTPIWERTEYLGHAYLIPAVSAWLLLERRRDLALAYREAVPPLTGPAIVFLAAWFEVLAVLGDLISVAGIGIPLLLAAAAYGVAGKRLLESAALPLGFLVMMVPPPGFVVSRILIDLKLFVTWISVELLQAGGAAVAAEGNKVYTPGHDLFVADACSGLTSIVTMLPLATVVAYFGSRGVWRRVVVVISVIPLAISANVARIIVTVAMVDELGVEVAQGLLHESFGVLTFVVGTISLLVLASWLR
jgi:exosortase